MSSRRRGGGNNKGFQLDALPFTISPDEALESFRKWAEQEQGLNYLLSYDSVRIGAAFVRQASAGTQPVLIDWVGIVTLLSVASGPRLEPNFTSG